MGALGRCSANDFRVNLAAANRLQRINLKRNGLIAGADASITNIHGYFSEPDNRPLF
jgi:hypothetical protein